MKLKQLLFASLIVLQSISVFGQGEKVRSVPQTYALVIGINKYKNIPPLSYAATDAQSFFELLKSSVFKVSPQNAVLLTDALATRSNILEKMYEYEEQLKPNDLLIFYFAGHGDIEAKIQTNNSLLLLPDIPSTNYLRSAEFLDMNTLKEYFGSLNNKKVKTLFICDACHSGNLVGGLQGQKVTASNLQESWTNEVKILSCQPNELSQESKNWGNGRGIFSYFLGLGCEGLADNGDGLLSLGELKRYIEREVATATHDRQNPMVVGDPKTFLCKVDPAILSVARSRKTNKGSSESVALRGIPIKKTPAFEEFETLLDNGSFLEPSDKNAFIIAQAILSNASYKGEWFNVEKTLYEYCNSHFQLIIQKYYNHEVLLPFQPTIYGLLQELNAAVSLVKNKYYAHDLQTMQHFLTIELISMQTNQISKRRLAEFAEVLKLDLKDSPSLAFLHKKYSEVLYGLGRYDEALTAMIDYVSLLPNDFYAYNFAGMALVKLKKYNQAEDYLQKAIQIKPNYFDAYYNLGVLYRLMGNESESSYYFKEANKVKEQRNPLRR